MDLLVRIFLDLNSSLSKYPDKDKTSESTEFMILFLFKIEYFSNYP